jgi:hypothetical protein
MLDRLRRMQPFGWAVPEHVRGELETETPRSPPCAKASSSRFSAERRHGFAAPAQQAGRVRRIGALLLGNADAQSFISTSPAQVGNTGEPMCRNH